MTNLKVRKLGIRKTTHPTANGCHTWFEPLLGLTAGLENRLGHAARQHDKCALVRAQDRVCDPAEQQDERRRVECPARG